MELAIQIFAVIALIAAASLFFYLIYAFSKLIKHFKGIEENVEKLTTVSIPLLAQYSKLGEKLTETVDDIAYQTEQFRNLTESIKNKISGFKSLEESAKNVGETANGMATNLRAVGVAVVTFINKLRGK